MGIFDKKVARPVGASFPFMEETDNDIRIKFDLMKVEYSNDQVSVVFYQDDIPIYAYSISPGITQGSVVFNDLTGSVRVRKVSA